MPPSVRAVTDLPGLGLRRLAGPDGRDRPVRWVAVSELDDPRPFLEGGELLLSTGMRLPADDPVALDGFVQRLVEAEVAAFGLGVGLSHAAAPTALVEAADRRGLPLLEVPAPTPFIAVSKAVSALLAAEEYDAMARGFETQRELTRAALRPDGAGAVVARLARALDGWVLELDPDGAVVHASPRGAGDRAPELAAEVAALRARGLLAATALGGSDEQVGLRPLGARGRVRGFLVVGTAAPLDRTEQSLVSVAVSLLSLDVERDDPADAVRAGVQRAALDLLTAGADPGALPLDGLGWAWLVDSALRVVVVSGPAAQRTAAVEALRAAPGAADRVVVVGPDELTVLVRDEPGPLATATSCLVGLTAGGSGPARLADLRTARQQARRASGGARAAAGARGGGGTAGGPVRWFDRLVGDGLLAAVDPQAGQAFAESLLAPLEGRRGDLVGSLAAWLRHHGSWDAAAAELGVHRHTLRDRMRRVEELLGRPLDDPDLRAEAWLAIRLRTMDTTS